MISDMTSFHDDAQVAVVCVWLYTRADILEDMVRHGGVCHEAAKRYLHSNWPTAINDSETNRVDYMLTTERTLVVLDGEDAHVKPAPSHVATRLCRDAIYHADASERRICDVNEAAFGWLNKIL